MYLIVNIFILFAISANAYVEMQIKLRPSYEYASVSAVGFDKHVVSDTECQTFQVIDKNIKDIITNLTGERPDIVYLRSPTPNIWGDLYRTYSYKEVVRNFYPVATAILEITNETIVIDKKEWVNNDTVSKTYDTGITTEISNTVSGYWTRMDGGKLDVGIDHVVDLGEDVLHFTSQYGEPVEISKMTTLGVPSGVEVELEAGQTGILTIAATRVSMKVKSTWSAKLDGDIVAYYPQTLNANNFYSFYVTYIQSLMEVETDLFGELVETISCYINPKIGIQRK